MAELYNILFVIQFLALLSIILFKLYNIMSANIIMDLRGGIILFILSIICFFIGLSIQLLEPDETLFSAIMNLETILIGLSLLFLVIDIFFYFRDSLTQSTQAYNSKMIRGR